MSVNRQWNDGFSDGVISSLVVLWMYEGCTTALYEEVVSTHGTEELVRRAKVTGNYASSGLKQYMKEQRAGGRRNRAGAEKVG